jgi:hypothetical protein
VQDNIALEAAGHPAGAPLGGLDRLRPRLDFAGFIYAAELPQSLRFGGQIADEISAGRAELFLFERDQTRGAKL